MHIHFRKKTKRLKLKKKINSTHQISEFRPLGKLFLYLTSKYLTTSFDKNFLNLDHYLTRVN